MICTGAIPFAAPSISPDGVTDTEEGVRQLGNQVSVLRTLSSILVYMCRHGLTIDDVGRNAFLIRAYGCDGVKHTRVDLLPTVANDTDHHFLPTVFTPRLAAIPLTQKSNVLHDAMHRPRK